MTEQNDTIKYQSIKSPLPNTINNFLNPLSNTTSLKPGKLNVIKRNGSITHYEDDKITIAITKI